MAATDLREASSKFESATLPGQACFSGSSQSQGTLLPMSSRSILMYDWYKLLFKDQKRMMGNTEWNGASFFQFTDGTERKHHHSYVSRDPKLGDSVLVLFGSPGWPGPNSVEITQWFPRNLRYFDSTTPWQIGFQISGQSSRMRKWKCTKSCGVSVSPAATWVSSCFSTFFYIFLYMIYFAFLPCPWVLQVSSVLLRSCFALVQAPLHRSSCSWRPSQFHGGSGVGIQAIQAIQARAHWGHWGRMPDALTPLQVAAFLGPATRALWPGRPWHDRWSSSWGVAAWPWAMAVDSGPCHVAWIQWHTVSDVSGIGWCHQEGDEQCRAVQSRG